MKKALWVKALTALLLMLGTITIMYTQNPHYLNGVIPFKFMVGSTSFSAGDYNILTFKGIIRIYGKDKHEGIYALSSPGNPINSQKATIGKIVFNKYGDKLFLAKVISPDEAAERKLSQSAAEKEASKTVAIAETVVIAMKMH
jgi:hypothetical protein